MMPCVLLPNATRRGIIQAIFPADFFSPRHSLSSSASSYFHEQILTGQLI
jgi:hypothetical protein